MNELIKIEKQGNKETVNARTLWEFLGSKQDFSTWIKSRIKRGFFIEDEDYTSLHKIVERGYGATARIEYFISIPMAKKISMMESTDKGNEVRDYFIEMEKKAKQVQLGIPQSFSEALRLAADQQEQIEMQSKLLIEQKPKVEFADAVLGSSDVIDLGSVAKTLNKGVGRNKLFQILRDKKILQQNNIPYQLYIDRGYFRTVEQKYSKPDGSIHINIKTMVYQKGVNYIRNIIEESK